MEIERKYLIPTIPDNLNITQTHIIEQGYLNTEPVVRIRRDNDEYVLTYKSKGLLIRDEYNLPLTKESYEHLKTKIDGRLIQKTRHVIPCGETLLIELDIFQHELAPLVLAEVEFPSIESSESFLPPDWFGEEVTYSSLYHNSQLSKY